VSCRPAPAGTGAAVPAPLGKAAAELQPGGSPGREEPEKKHFKKNNSNVGVSSWVWCQTPPRLDRAVPQFPLPPRWHLGWGRRHARCGAGGGRWLERSPLPIPPGGRPGALLSCRSCGHRSATAGWDKRGGGHGGVRGQGQGLGDSQPRGRAGRAGAVSPHPAVGRGMRWPPPCCSSDPLKGFGGDAAVPSPVPWGAGAEPFDP